MKTYTIIRFRKKGKNQIIAIRQTLKQAQAHCNREDTKGDGWFDGYQEENKK